MKRLIVTSSIIAGFVLCGNVAARESPLEKQERWRTEQTKRLSPIEQMEEWRTDRTKRLSPSEKVEEWHRTYRKEQVERDRRREEDRREYWEEKRKQIED